MQFSKYVLILVRYQLHGVNASFIPFLKVADNRPSRSVFMHGHPKYINILQRLNKLVDELADEHNGFRKK